MERTKFKPKKKVKKKPRNSVKEENHTTIQGWMITDLKLKGHNLIAYAIIYGFSQDGESKYTGSNSYLGTWLQVSEPTIIKVLKYLVQEELIIKTPIIIKGVTFNEYTHNKETLGVLKKLKCTTKETLVLTTKETLVNKELLYNEINNKEKNTKKKNPKIQLSQFEKFWELYPKKIDKGKCLTIWNRICARKDNVPTFNEIKKALHYQKSSERWQDPKFIKHPSTWLNNAGWLDDPNEMKTYNFNNTSNDKFKGGAPKHLEKDHSQYQVAGKYNKKPIKVM